MNKFIEHDFRNGLILLKCAVINVLYAFKIREIIQYKFTKYISPIFVKDCMIESKWENIDNDIWVSPSGDEFKFENNLLIKNEKNNNISNTQC